METRISLQGFDVEMTHMKIEDLQKKIDIAFNVYNQCNQGEIFNDKGRPLEKCSKLTGVDKETLTVVKKLEGKSLSFETWFNEQNKMIYSYNSEYYELKKLLSESYTKKFQIPSESIIKEEFECYKEYFTSIPLPGTKASIIVEKPETIQERHSFLQKKMLYRKEKKHFVYIGKVSILLNHGTFSYREDTVGVKSTFVIAAAPTLGHIGYIYGFQNKEEFIKNWLTEKIVPELPDDSVVIIQENVLKSPDKIHSFTTRADMIKWLNINNINHDPKMHRAELLKLINASKHDIEELSKPEQLMRARGHITMRKTKCNLCNYFDPFWDFLMHELNASAQKLPSINFGLKYHTHVVTKTVNTTVQTVPLDYWQNLENILMEKERQVYEEDLEMENVIDKLMTLVKHEGLEGVQLDEYSKTKERPHMFLLDSLRNLLMQSCLKS